MFKLFIACLGCYDPQKEAAFIAEQKKQKEAAESAARMVAERKQQELARLQKMKEDKQAAEENTKQMEIDS